MAVLNFLSRGLAPILLLSSIGLAQTYEIKLYNADDILTAKISNSQVQNLEIARATFGQDTQFIDFTKYVQPGPNTLHIELTNNYGGYTYGFQYRLNGVVAKSDLCGQAGVAGCTVGDQNRQNQVVYTNDIPITGPSGGGTSPPVVAYEGYLDGADCNHVWGWARDKNKPGTAVNVDLSIDGQVTTLKAGDFRDQLPDGGYHAFNDYALPTFIKDGFRHNISATITGSTFVLVGSPYPFQNLCAGEVITNANQWTYNTDAYANPQNGWWARLVKTPISGSRYQYSIYLLLSNGGSFLNASAAVVSDLHIGMVRGSYSTQATQVIAPQPSYTNFQWQNPPNYDQSNSLSNIAFDLWGFVNPEVGVIWGATDIIGNLRDLSRTNISPSAWLTNKMLDENTYRVSRMAYSPSSGVFTGLQNITGINFNVTVDENNGLQPEFFVRAQTKLGTMVGIEIGQDRNALINAATWNPF